MHVNSRVRQALSAVLRLGVVGGATLLTACGVNIHGTATPAPDLGPAPMPVPGEFIGMFLASTEKIASIVSAQSMELVDIADQMDTGRTAADDCVATFRVGWLPVYVGSGWTAVESQYMTSVEGATFEHKVWQSVVAFPRPVDAAGFYSKQVADWTKCSGRRVNSRILDDPAGSDGFWTLGDAADVDGMLTILIVMEGGDGWTCQTALTTRNNVVVSTEVCGDQVTNEGAAVASAVADKIPPE